MKFAKFSRTPILKNICSDWFLITLKFVLDGKLKFPPLLVLFFLKGFSKTGRSKTGQNDFTDVAFIGFNYIKSNYIRNKSQDVQIS